MSPQQPSGIVTPEAVLLEFDTAGVGSRTAAVLLDVMVQLGTLGLIGMAAFFLAGAVGGASGTIAIIVLLILTLVVIVGYPLTMESIWHGRTLGMAALGLRVVTVEGGPVRVRQSATRAIIGVFELWATFGSVAVLVTILTPDNQRLGDLVAGTLVLRERAASSTTATAMSFPAPYGYADYVASIDVSVLTSDQYGVIRTFLMRVLDLTIESRAALAVKLANATALELHHTPPSNLPPELFLVCVASAYQARHGGVVPAPQWGGSTWTAAPPQPGYAPQPGYPPPPMYGQPPPGPPAYGQPTAPAGYPQPPAYGQPPTTIPAGYGPPPGPPQPSPVGSWAPPPVAPSAPPPRFDSPPIPGSPPRFETPPPDGPPRFEVPPADPLPATDPVPATEPIQVEPTQVESAGAEPAPWPPRKPGPAGTPVPPPIEATEPSGTERVAPQPAPRAASPEPDPAPASTESTPIWPPRKPAPAGSITSPPAADQSPTTTPAPVDEPAQPFAPPAEWPPRKPGPHPSTLAGSGDAQADPRADPQVDDRDPAPPPGSAEPPNR